MDTNKLTALSRLVNNLIWLVIAIVVLATVGRWLVWSSAKSTTTPHSKSAPAPPIDWAGVDREIVDAIKSASNTAEKAAEKKMDLWVESLMKRVDEDFLEWYFSYWNQQVLGLKAVWYWSVNKVMTDQPEAAERITEEIQEEFSKRVLRPELAQLELERITTEVLAVFVGELSKRLSVIPGRYNIPQPDWERYLDDIAVLTSRVEGNREVPLSLKTVTATAGGGAALVAKALGPVLKKSGTKVSAKLAGKAAGKMAAKTGAKVAGKAGGKFLGPIIGIGILVWDIWDHNTTKKVERPILRQIIADYFGEVKHNLVHEPETGIMSAIRTIEANVVNSLRTQPVGS